jgi:hypothetical protein
VAACGGARDIVDNWPTFVVEGTVLASDGTPLKSVQVEAGSFHGPCNQDPLWQRVTSVSDGLGHYAVGMDDVVGTFSGCVSVRATLGQGPSARSAEADTVLTGLPIVEGQTRVTLDLRFP